VRVFLDTNVLVAAFATRGLCADVVRVVLDRHDLIVSEQVLEELDAALDTKLGVPTERRALVLSYLRQFEVVAHQPGTPLPKVRDPTDATVLAAAIQGRADVLVSGDRDLLAVLTPDLKIVSPRGFWELVGPKPPTRP
jgi:putative PIN family toxin of toxin-antitoxin system